jgi:type IV secretory pathway VirB10-like protein
MTDESPRSPTPEPEAPREGAVYRGPGPRLRRVGRTAAVLAVLTFIGLLAFLTPRYAHQVGPAAGEEDAGASPIAARPLTAERIEELARRRLEEEIRAARPAPPPPELDLDYDYLDEPLPLGPPAFPPPPASGVSPPPAPGPRHAALRSPLSPGGSGASGPAQGDPGRSMPAPPAFPEWPPLGLPADRLAPGAPGSALHPGERATISSAAPPLDRRAIEIPDSSAYALTRLPAPHSPTLYTGTAVPLVLTHDLATDVAGPVRAYVARDVFDSLTRTRLVIPRGSLALGHQAAHAATGDRRILIHWSRLVLPSGASYELPVLPAGSVDGTAGVRARVDNHWWGRFGSAVALSLVGAGVQLSQPQERTSLQGLAPSEGQVMAQHLGLDLGRLSQELLRRGANRPPTLHLPAGSRLTLLLTRDLAFPR